MGVRVLQLARQEQSSGKTGGLQDRWCSYLCVEVKCGIALCFGVKEVFLFFLFVGPGMVTGVTCANEPLRKRGGNQGKGVEGFITVARGGEPKRRGRTQGDRGRKDPRRGTSLYRGS